MKKFTVVSGLVGNAGPGEVVELDAAWGAKLVEAGFVVPVEIPKPEAPKVEPPKSNK